VVTIVTLTILIQGALWLVDTVYMQNNAIAEVDFIETEHIKNELQHQVESIIEFIEFRSKKTDEVLREELTEHTYEAHAIMTSIYESNKNTKTEAEIREMIVDALIDVRFNDGRVYFFIDTLDGEVVMAPPIPETHGQNWLDLQDDNGNYTIQDEIHVVETKGEGFVEGYWKKPESVDGMKYRKITFVKHFKPYNWYVGCGDYVDEMTKQIQEEVITYVNELRFGIDNNDYVFIHDTLGYEIANGAFPELIGTNNIDLEDSAGNLVIQNQIEVSANGGGFLDHYWKSVTGRGEDRKITYVQAYEEWNWVIGSGQNASTLENKVLASKNELITELIRKAFFIVVFLIMLIVISVHVLRGFLSKIRYNIDVFTESIVASNEKLVEIRSNDLDYEEFVGMAKMSNKMTRRINNLLNYDQLTMIHNRRYITSRLGNILKQKRPVAVAIFDVDKFKTINDKFGHITGDDVLFEIAQTIKEEIKGKGIVGRFGGEEFLVLIHETDKRKILKIANDIRRAVEANHISSIDRSITISGGVACSKDFDSSKLLSVADKNMYKAKRSGRNKVVM
jgi:diguanylate cyclase (GGDEF)-like protein